MPYAPGMSVVASKAVQSGASANCSVTCRWRWKGCWSLQDPLCSVPHPWEWRTTQSRSQLVWYLWPQDRSGRRILLHCCQRQQGYHLDWWDLVRVLGEPQEVHPWHQDGLCWIEEGQGQEGLDCLLEARGMLFCFHFRFGRTGWLTDGCAVVDFISVSPIFYLIDIPCCYLLQPISSICSRWCLVTLLSLFIFFAIFSSKNSFLDIFAHNSPYPHLHVLNSSLFGPL